MFCHFPMWYPGSDLVLDCISSDLCHLSYFHSADDGSIFWDSQPVVMIDFLEQGRIINGAYYAAEWRQLCQEIAKKRRGKLTCSVLLLKDTAPAHTSQVAMTAVIECEYKILPHPNILPIWLLLTSIYSTVWKQ